MPDKSLTTACIQLCSGQSIDRNLSNCTELIKRAAGAGAALIATPEMTPLLEQNPKRLLEKVDKAQQDSCLEHFQRLAKELGVAIIIGSMAIRANQSQCLNRSYAINANGSIVAHYDKIHLFDAVSGNKVYSESSSYIAGSKAVIADIAGARIGMTICYDLRFPALFQHLAQAGAQIITVPAAFTRPTGEAHWHTLLRARAIENNCFIVAPAQSGLHEDGRETYGHSLIVDPWGKVLCDGGTESGFYLQNIDLEQIDKVRKSLPNLENQQHFQPVSF